MRLLGCGASTLVAPTKLAKSETAIKTSNFRGGSIAWTRDANFELVRVPDIAMRGSQLCWEHTKIA